MIIATRGLPASGKTTWARAQKKLRVNRDDIRAMLNLPYNSETEKIVLASRDAAIKEAVSQGKDIIVDETNLTPKHIENLQALGEVQVKDFNTDVLECIKRDKVRMNQVGESVIMGMHLKYLYKEERNPHLPPAIIVDIDGTVALKGDRKPFDYSRVGEDLPNMPVIDLLRQNTTHIIFVSGRESSCQVDTESWLRRYFQDYTLYMRQAGDYRPDYVVKKEVYQKYIIRNFYVTTAIDDRDSVVALWRSLGLTCLQVAYGDF